MLFLSSEREWNSFATVFELVVLSFKSALVKITLPNSVVRSQASSYLASVTAFVALSLLY